MEVITKADEIRENVKEAFGFVPNLIDAMAEESPAVAEVYLTANRLMGEASLSQKEQQAVILAVSAHNECHYCTAAHAKIGASAGIAQDDVDAILAGDLPSEERLRRLVLGTRRILDKRGWLDEDDLAEFEAQGLDRGAIYEIVALVGIKTISNYVNHINKTEIDPQFQ